MALLAGTCYDPGTAVSKSGGTRTVMTAFDTTNLRLTFTAPANGIVMVRIRCVVQSVGATYPTILLGVLDGSTVKGRISPVGVLPGTAAANTRPTQEALFTVGGLTPGASYTWDAAYGIEVLLTSSNIKYGGPDTTSGADAWGGLVYEIYDTPTILAQTLYDPSTAVAKSTGSLLAMTALDTTNLRLTFTAPASGNVLVRLGTLVHGATTFPQILLGVLESSTIIGRVPGIGGLKTSAVATAQLAMNAEFVVTGLTPSSSYTWDAAYAVQQAVATTNIQYGGPNNTTSNDAWGGFLYEIWAV